MGCKKAQGFLETYAVEVTDRTDAGKEKRGRAEALALAKSADQVWVGKGKKFIIFDMSSPPDDDTLAANLLGPTGNLKAPTLRRGRTLLVGFSEPAYEQFFQ
jgi:hypothetical protein